MISVILPVLNGASTIADQLEALERQRVPGEWEVLVVDNGSTDDTVDVASTYLDRLPLRILDGSEHPGRSAVRNFAVEHARGEDLAFVDADDVICDGWIEAMVAHLADESVVTGPYVRVDHSWRPGDPVADTTSQPSFAGQPTLNAGNFVIKHDLYLAIGGFDTRLRARVDTDLTFRLREQGQQIGFAPDAFNYYRLRPGGRGQFSQQYQWGVAAAWIYRRYRRTVPIPHSTRNSLKHWGKAIVMAPIVIPRSDKRTKWFATVGSLLGRAVGSIRYRVLYL
jgi:glycosyltransferase involved in cell wall biosynthesis